MQPSHERSGFHVRPIPREEATGPLAGIYERMSPGDAPIPHIMSCCGLNPDAVATHAGLYRAVMFGRSPRSRLHREMVGVAVWRTNGCFY